MDFGDVTREGFGYNSIVRAVERLILLRSPVLPRQYPANFEGITRALYDLGDVMAGIIPPSGEIGSGIYPPHWDPVSGGYPPGYLPPDGSLWFDQRQGRLFVADGGEWFQANGGEGLIHLGPQPPARQTPGASWFDTRQGVTFTWIDEVTAAGEAGWYQMNGGGDNSSGGAMPFDLFLPAAIEIEVSRVTGSQAIMLFKTTDIADESIWTSGQLNIGATFVKNETMHTISSEMQGPNGHFDCVWRMERQASDPDLIVVFVTSPIDAKISGRISSSL